MNENMKGFFEDDVIKKIIICAEIRRILDGVPGVDVWKDIHTADEGTDFSVKMSVKIEGIAEEYFYLEKMKIQWF